jgi:arylsulfatase A-like enzyme
MEHNSDRCYIFFPVIIILALVSGCTPTQSIIQKRPPNIIYILADDLGYGDLSSYGQKKFQTPNIDRLASQGMRFTQHYSGSTVCAPSRSTLMTGQHTGHTPVRGNKNAGSQGQIAIEDEVYTVAELLRQQGYITGGFGKWGLGAPGSHGDPLKQGFDIFYGYYDQRIAHNYYPGQLWDNGKKVILKENLGSQEGTYAPELIHKETLAFIENNKGRPFFAYVPSVIPHAELKIPETYLKKYRGKLLPEKSYQGCDAGCKRYKIGGYGSQKEGHAAFAAMIDMLDQQVGEIVAKVKELGLENNTLIIFTSDNGPHKEGGADPDYFGSNGVYRGYKRDLYEGGIRVPMIACWPGTIKVGTTSDHASAFWDVLPTLAQITGAKVPTQIDGISFLPTLLNKEQSKHKALYWEFHERHGPAQAVLMDGRWKAIRKIDRGVLGTIELYDLKADPGEQRDIAQKQTKWVAKAVAFLDQERTDSPVKGWNFDRIKTATQ